MVKNKTQTQNLAETIFKSICPNHKCGLFNIIKHENTILGVSLYFKYRSLQVYCLLMSFFKLKRMIPK